MALEEFLYTIVEDAAAPVKSEIPDQSAREEAVRRMLEFGEKHHLSLGKPITRQLLHEGHRY